jgi:hypothetical protein
MCLTLNLVYLGRVLVVGWISDRLVQVELVVSHLVNRC